MVELHIDKGADLSLGCPLHIACMQHHLDISKVLIENGADVNKLDRGGETPLDVFVKSKAPELVKLLKKNGGKTSRKLGEG